MTRTTSSRRTAGALLALALVATAGAPSVITVAPGDTLWGLARGHGTSVEELQRLNQLGGNSTIYAGRTLVVPGSATAPSTQAATGAARFHVVRSGDTLSGLAVEYGVSAPSIQAANGLDSTVVQLGRRLAVPAGAARPAPADLSSVPTTNAGVTIPERVRRSVAEHRAVLSSRSHPSKDQIRRMVAATARQHGVSPSLAVAVAYHESGFKQHVVSGVDAIGVMQVLPSTGRTLNSQLGRDLDLLDTQDNVTAGVLLLRQLVRSTGSDDAALAGYYQGLGSISRRGLLPQTHSYIASINGLRDRFANG